MLQTRCLLSTAVRNLIRTKPGAFTVAGSVAIAAADDPYETNRPHVGNALDIRITVMFEGS